MYLDVSCEKEDKTTACFSDDGKWLLDTRMSDFIFHTIR